MRPAWEDQDAFFVLDTDGGFAFEAVITLAAGGTRTIAAIFDDPKVESKLGEFEMDTTGPRITARETDLVGVKRKGTVTIKGKQFDVLSNPLPDGTGLAMLRLAPSLVS